MHTETTHGVPQGSMPGLIYLFIYLFEGFLPSENTIGNTDTSDLNVSRGIPAKCYKGACSTSELKYHCF